MKAAVATQPQHKPWRPQHRPCGLTIEEEEEVEKDIELAIQQSCLTGFKPRSDNGGRKFKIFLPTPVRKPASPSLPRVIERLSCSKFGGALKPDASSQVSTSSSEGILLERSLGSKVDEPAAVGDPLGSKGDAVLKVCETCGEKGDHWTFRCHFNDVNSKIHWEEEGHGATIIVTNLSKDIDEWDLYNLLCRFGLVFHVSLAVDEDSDSSLQFAVVQYGQSEEAELAMSWLDGFTYQGIVLGAGWTTRPKGADPQMCPSCRLARELELCPGI